MNDNMNQNEEQPKRRRYSDIFSTSADDDFDANGESNFREVEPQTEKTYTKKVWTVYTEGDEHTYQPIEGYEDVPMTAEEIEREKAYERSEAAYDAAVREAKQYTAIDNEVVPVGIEFKKIAGVLQGKYLHVATAQYNGTTIYRIVSHDMSMKYYCVDPMLLVQESIIGKRVVEHYFRGDVYGTVISVDTETGWKGWYNIEWDDVHPNQKTKITKLHKNSIQFAE